MNAHCQCTTITFSLPHPRPLKIYICHCLECRFQSTSTYGLSLIFPAVPFPLPLSNPNLKVWTRTTFEGREKKCYFCGVCGSRIAHWIEGQEVVTLKGCVDGLTGEMVRGAIHIWCKRAVVEIPEGCERWEGEPEGGTGDGDGDGKGEEKEKKWEKEKENEGRKGVSWSIDG